MKNMNLLLLLFVIFITSCSNDEKNPVKPTVLETGTVTDIDGNIYKTVKIGSQWWMAENLQVKHYRNGDDIPIVTSNSQWKALTTDAYCYYENDSSFAEYVGALYNWYAVNDSRKIAPAGWHVPTDADWKQLEMTLGMSQSDADNTGWRGTNEGGKLKETGITYWRSPNTGATNASGFSARAGGYRNFDDGGFYLVGNSATFWSATALSSDYAWYRDLSNTDSKVNRYIFFNKKSGLSVRLVRD